jgi:hypothetical protein
MIFLAACERDPILTEVPSVVTAEPISVSNVQVETFEALWNAIDENYIYGLTTDEI